MEDKQKFKEALKMVESKYKYFDSIHWLVKSAQTKIAVLLVKEKLSKVDEIELATQMYLLKALSKLSVVENTINNKENQYGRN
ncbi:hypothetical protein [Bacteroides sp. 224]|uniref:hypothetical protein n=1 Tax=Bacteroides sp. 224 TaxID=2302936 RepID=UPI0013D43FF5|nr:hypothetical protein [Bacteroides sp. 224]NDV63781.1 hypothetical protein [Bacteroides sp. 224]